MEGNVPGAGLIALEIEMRPSPLSAILAFSIILLALPATGPANGHEPPRFSKPIIQASALHRADQAIVLDFRSNGCFHQVHYRFRYEPMPTPRIKV